MVEHFKNKTEGIHFPGLNGLRAIAALSVLWGHCMQDTFGNWGISEWHLPFLSDGVTMFFVISGFLITFLLLQEIEKMDTINVPKFYMRRILRIWPIYYGYIFITIGILWLLGRQNEVVNPTLWFYVFFAANVPFALVEGLWPIVHYWSIGVEEQFYLFWPWIVKLGKKRILRIAIVFCCFWIACKWGSYIVWGKCEVYRFFAVTRFDCMFFGAIGAILYNNRNRLFMKWMSNKIVIYLAWCLLLLSSVYIEIIPAPLRSHYIAILSLVTIMSQVIEKSCLINLETRVFDFVGKISYGIYVLHPIVIFVVSKWYKTLNLSMELHFQYVIIYLGVTLITIGVAWLSYNFYEKPFLKLKSRFSIIESKSSLEKK